MAPRTEFHEILAGILGSHNVYFQPPANIKMKYPAIVYDFSRLGAKRADNKVYSLRTAYDVTLIEYAPDSDKIPVIMDLPYAEFDRSFISDNLYHTTFTIYY